MDAASFIGACQDRIFSPGPANEAALRYLTEERGLLVPTIREVGFGYCSHDQELFGDSSQNWKLRGRVVVPIMSEFGGAVAAVAGRKPDPAEKGWWNTSCPKDEYIFLLHLARRAIFEANKAYVFEGYLDASWLRQSGLPNSVAIMGTSLGYRRIGILARYCDRICLCFDNDPNDAGLIGQLKSIADLGMFGFGTEFGSISTIKMPKKMDPDEYVRQCGLAAFLALEKVVKAEDVASAKARYQALKRRKFSGDGQQKETNS